MKKTLTVVFLGVALFMIAAPAFAQPASAQTSGGGPSDKAWSMIAGCFAMCIASAVCGFAQSRAIAAACEGMARNPGAAPSISQSMLLGLVFIESLALLTLVIVFVKASV
jgi:F-type H+-transporting ATPase subunit c